MGSANSSAGPCLIVPLIQLASSNLRVGRLLVVLVSPRPGQTGWRPKANSNDRRRHSQLKAIISWSASPPAFLKVGLRSARLRQPAPSDTAAISVRHPPQNLNRNLGWATLPAFRCVFSTLLNQASALRWAPAGVSRWKAGAEPAIGCRPYPSRSCSSRLRASTGDPSRPLMAQSNNSPTRP